MDGGADGAVEDVWIGGDVNGGDDDDVDGGTSSDGDADEEVDD